MQENESIDSKKEKKRAMISSIMSSADTLRLFTPRRKYEEDRLPNNTYFMSYHLYQGRQDNFKKELDNDFGGKLNAYIKHLTEKYPYL
jgi:hypothetical protein